MGEKLYYDALFDREIGRLEEVIQQRKERDLEFEQASSKIKSSFDLQRKLADFWLDKESLTKADKLEYLLQSLSHYAGRGIVGKVIPGQWNFEVKKWIKSSAENAGKLAKYAREFALFLEGWSEMNLEEPVHREVVKQMPEAYALLYMFKGDVEEADQSELEEYVQCVKRGNYGFPGLLTASRKLLDLSIPKKAFLDPTALETFLQNYLAEDERQWESIYPKLKNGLETLAEFVMEKGKSIYGQEEKIKSYEVELLDEWKSKLIQFDLNSLENYGKNRKLREKLAMKYEKGIEL